MVSLGSHDVSVVGSLVFPTTASGLQNSYFGASKQVSTLLQAHVKVSVATYEHNSPGV